jgi:hypothetical protein
MRIRELARLSVAVLGLAACGGGGAEPSKPTPVAPAQVVTTVVVTPAVPQVAVGLTVALSAEIRDQTGSIFSGKTATWSSANTAVATVDAATGVVTGVTPGSSVVSATVDGKSGVATVIVQPPPVASVVVASPVGALAVGQTVALVPVLADKSGGVLTGRKVTWSSSFSRAASVDTSGKVTALTAGTTAITALSEGVSGTATVVVSAPAGTTAPAIAAVAPATLTPGATGTITGTNFVASATNASVYVAGVQAAVTAATPTTLTFTVPSSGIPCQSTHPVNVEVTTLAGTATAKQTLQVATLRTLAVGASFMATTAGNVGCNEVPATGTYLVSVFNAAPTLPQSATFELSGNAGAVVPTRIATPEVLRSIVTTPPLRMQHPVSAQDAATEQEHIAHLEQDAQLFRQLGSPRRYRQALRSLSPSGVQTSRSTSPVPTTVGQNAQLRFHYNSCTIANSIPITARVVYVGTKSIVLEDNAAPLAGKLDADLVALGKEFDDVSYPLLTNFGNPLAYDDSTDANGRIIMLFTPQVNNQSAGLLGFVSSCDFYPPSRATSVASSNQAEIFYARAVTDTTPGSNTLNAKSQWKRQMPSTMIHEAKHIAAYAERFATPVVVTDFEDTWLEEATAQVASELYGRAIHGNGWRTNSTYTGILDCEVRPSTASCNGATFIMGNHFGFLSDYLQNFESKTILRAFGDGDSDNDIYGSSWMFSRWLIDTYGGADEGTFMRSIVKNYNITGVNNVTSVTGRTWAQLLSEFSLMLAADDLPGVQAPYVESSWNMPGVWAGYNTDFPTSRPASPLTPRNTSFGSFSTGSVQLKGGGAMVMRMTGGVTGGTQLLDLHRSNGAALSSTSTLGIAVLRIQ